MVDLVGISVSVLLVVVNTSQLTFLYRIARRVA